MSSPVRGHFDPAFSPAQILPVLLQIKQQKVNEVTISECFI
jgi:hypothetical protein